MKFCLYCGQAGHFITSCPTWPKDLARHRLTKSLLRTNILDPCCMHLAVLSIRQFLFYQADNSFVLDSTGMSVYGPPVVWVQGGGGEGTIRASQPAMLQKHLVPGSCSSPLFLSPVSRQASWGTNLDPPYQPCQRVWLSSKDLPLQVDCQKLMMWLIGLYASTCPRPSRDMGIPPAMYCCWSWLPRWTWSCILSPLLLPVWSMTSQFTPSEVLSWSWF